MIQKFIAVTTIVGGIFFLILGIYAFANPDTAGANAWTKAVVSGLALVAIGAVALAGTRRTE